MLEHVMLFILVLLSHVNKFSVFHGQTQPATIHVIRQNVRDIIQVQLTTHRLLVS